MSGLLPQVVDDDIISLQYSNDTSLFLEDDIERAKNPKWLLICYEHMTDMKISYESILWPIAAITSKERGRGLWDP
jgi:hypothetical protein